MESRLISIEEANRMLPLLRHIVQDIVSNWALIIFKRTELECMEKGVDSGAARPTADRRDAGLQNLKHDLNYLIDKINYYIREVDTKNKEEIDWEFDRNFDHWPGRALHWVKQYGITDYEMDQYEFGYSESQRRVIIAIWWEEEKVGYQARKIYDDDLGPKYITKGGGLPGFMLHANKGLEEIVLVEDVISAIKVGRVTNSVALLSTNPTRKALDYIKQFSNFKIWLDMDNPQVIRQALKLLKSIAVFGNYKLLVTSKDPKCYSDIEIREHLYGS